MDFPIPDFIPVPSSETILIISIVLLIIGICLVGGGLFLLFLHKQKGKKITIPWISIVVGILLTVNHGMKILLSL